MSRHRMRGTSEQHASQLRRFILNVPAGSFTSDRARRDRQLLAAIHGRFPEMVEELGAACVLALTRALEDGACSWCAAAQIARSRPGRDPGPAGRARLDVRQVSAPPRRCEGRSAGG
jgi:hypothetical protein